MLKGKATCRFLGEKTKTLVPWEGPSPYKTNFAVLVKEFSLKTTSAFSLKKHLNIFPTRQKGPKLAYPGDVRYHFRSLGGESAL
jgi:hypothetical protein